MSSERPGAGTTSSISGRPCRTCRAPASPLSEYSSSHSERSRLTGGDHRHAVDVEQQLLRAGHTRALARGEDDPTDRQKCCRESLEGRSRGPDPLHLDAGADRDLREVAEARAVTVDEEKPASNQWR